jgi:ABC-type multidrug transport system fused ATPase/permease subunit
MTLMAFQAIASNARLLLLWPIIDRVLGADEAMDLEANKDVAGTIKTTKRKVGDLLKPLDRVVDGMNSGTRSWVPDAWIGKAANEEERERQRDRYATLFTVLLLFLLLIAVMTASAFFEDYVNVLVQQRILMDVRKDLTAKLLEQPIAFYDGARRGELVQRVMDDVHGFSSALRLMLSSLPESGLHLIAGILVLAALSVELTAVCFVGLLLFLPLRLITRKVKGRAKRRQAKSARRVEVLLQIVSGIRIVKALRAEDRKVAEFHEADKEVFKRGLKLQRTKSAADAASEFVNNLLVMVLAVGAAFLMLRGLLPIGPGALVLFLSQLANLYKPAKRLIREINGMNDAMASVERVLEFMDLPGPVPDPPGAKTFEGIRGRVRFEDVGFEYRPGLPVLEGITFDVEKGATVALVGPSGAGKSTVCDLLLRFYEPTRGRITVDGVPLRDFARASFLDRTAVVTQDPFLFHTSIGDNIRQGRPTATEAEIEAAARAAQIHDHIASIPLAYGAEVGERGARLSGGQRQRITIARALVRDPLLLVLDEATASLDAESERGVQEAIDRLREGRTTLVVAHRLSTVKRADRIVVLDQGRIVDQGTHEELLARGGLYARLCAMQNLGAEPSPPAADGETASIEDPEDPEDPDDDENAS